MDSVRLSRRTIPLVLEIVHLFHEKKLNGMMGGEKEKETYSFCQSALIMRLLVRMVEIGIRPNRIRYEKTTDNLKISSCNTKETAVHVEQRRLLLCK
jgi:hypothetical protein